MHYDNYKEYLEERWQGVKKIVNKKKTLPNYNGTYGDPVDNKAKYIQLYEKSLNDLINILEKSFPGCKFYEDGSENDSEIEFENVILVKKFKPVINLNKNFDILKKVDKKGIFKDCNSINDVDGNVVYKFLKEMVFNKLTNFKEADYTYGMFLHKSFEELAIFCDEDFEKISISIKIPIKKN